MPRYRSLLAALSLAVGAATCPAGPLDLKEVPADTKWLVHFDADAIRQSQFYQAALARADRDSNGEASRKLAAVTTLLGTRLEDLHSLTFLGRGVMAVDGATVAGGVAIVHGKLDRERLAALAKLNPDYVSTPYGDAAISSWRDPKTDKTMHGAILANDSVLVLGADADGVKRALDTITGKSKPFSPESSGAVAAAGKGAGALLFIAGEGLSDLQKSQNASPVLAQLDSAWIAVTESPTDLTVRAAVTAKSPEAANQLRAMADGLKALAALATSPTTSPPEQRALVDATARATLSITGSTVNVEWPVPLATIKSVLSAEKPATGKSE